MSASADIASQPAKPLAATARTVIKAVRNTACEVRAAWSVADDLRSRVRLSIDFGLYRVLRVTTLPASHHERTIKCLDGASITYRLNRGDIETIRHVFLDETYRLPFDLSITTLVDLGANIGLTSLWLHRRYGFQQAIVVEPNAANAELARRNLTRNRIPAIVLNAAVGAANGLAHFVEGSEPNLGRIVEAEARDENLVAETVEAISMPSILQRIGGSATLVKVDIEGSEEAILRDPSWLDGADALIVEFHHDFVDYPGLVRLIERKGFRFFPAASVYRHTADAFLRAG